MNALTPVQQGFRNAMAALSAAVNVITTDGPGGRCGITATAVCSVTDSPPTLLVCVNRSSAMNAVFKTNARLCVNVLAGEHEEVARHFAGMTGVDMDERFARHAWGQSAQGLPLLEDALASLQGRIVETQEVGTHSVFLVELDEIATREHCASLVYFGRHFHQLQPVSAA